MKKFFLSVLTMGTLAFLANAVTYMRVHKNDGQIVQFNVDDVEKVDYAEVETPSDTTKNDTVTQGVTISGNVGNYTYVDLGLPSGLKWATYNVGASTPTEYGDYFAWGETSPKESYSWSTYKWCTVDSTGEYKKFTKYIGSSSYGTVDTFRVLEAADDAATANWGTGWRMPTSVEQSELISGCNWEWTDSFNGSGVAGRIGTSKTNGNIIFLPAAGVRQEKKLNHAAGSGYSWSSDLYTNASYTAYYTDFNSSSIFTSYSHRFNGLSVRAVVDGNVKEKKYYVVSFYTADSLLIEKQNVEEKMSATPPVAPERTGYDFFCWIPCIDTVTSDMDVYAYYEKQLPDLYVDVESKDSVVFKQNGKMGYFLVTSASTSSITLEVSYNGEKKELVLSDAASGAAYCGTDLKLMQLSDAVAKPTRVLFAKTAGMARICSPTSVANTIIASKSSETRFQLFPSQEKLQGVSVSGSVDNYTYVDLGLNSGTKWATYNVGATKPTEYGDYFAWGETSPKTTYSWSTYKWCDQSETKLTRYCMSSSYGNVDSLSTLQAEDDAATVNMSKNWRTPTKEEIQELIDGCDWQGVQDYNNTGIGGQLGTSKKNGNTIFLPAAGCIVNAATKEVGVYAYYISSNIYKDSQCSYITDIHFSLSTITSFYHNRCHGRSVRAVLND